MKDYELDAAYNLAAVAHMNVETVETVKSINGVNYVKRDFILNGSEYKPSYFECNLTVKSTEEEIVSWIKNVFPEKF